MLTTPRTIRRTETSLEMVNLSVIEDGKMEARTRVKRPDAEEMILTTPASVSLRASW